VMRRSRAVGVSDEQDITRISGQALRLRSAGTAQKEAFRAQVHLTSSAQPSSFYQPGIPGQLCQCETAAGFVSP
jgi:hypothetical protein